MQFILKSLAFLLKLANYRLDQCFGHEWILTLVGALPKPANHAMSTPEVNYATRNRLTLSVKLVVNVIARVRE